LLSKDFRYLGRKGTADYKADRFHGTYPPNINEGTRPISVKGPTQYQVVPLDF
jgi:hypothetical protein